VLKKVSYVIAFDPFSHFVGQFGISDDALEREAHTLDLKYSDLLNIFLEKGSQTKIVDNNKNK
jgi:hypothetical protein